MKNKIETESVELKDEAKMLAEMFYCISKYLLQ